MTADGWLYIDEDCMDKAKQKLVEMFGEDNFECKIPDWLNDVWDLSQMADIVNVDVVDVNNNEKLAEVVITNSFYVEEDSFTGKYVGCKCDKVEIIDMSNGKIYIV